jgi:NADH-quinone oxidoreductase subunit A
MAPFRERTFRTETAAPLRFLAGAPVRETAPACGNLSGCAIPIPSTWLVLRPLLRCAKASNDSNLTQIAALNVRGTGSAMTSILPNYLPIVIFILVAAALSFVMLVAPFVVAYQQPDPEKLSAYECGFNAFGDARMKFDVRFYLVAILFIIFDLEVAFLFPWAVAFGQLGATGFWSMMVFLGVLTVGFAYEWKKGALEWD